MPQPQTSREKTFSFIKQQKFQKEAGKSQQTTAEKL